MSNMGMENRVASGRVPFTRRKLVTAGAIAACALAVTATAVEAQSEPGSIEWSIQRNGSGTDARKVQLTIESRWGSNSQVNLAIHGVSADYVRRLRQSGMAKVSADQLVRLR